MKKSLIVFLMLFSLISAQQTALMMPVSTKLLTPRISFKEFIEPKEVVIEEKVESIVNTTRITLTRYCRELNGSCTTKGNEKFQVNENGWYTYWGMVVIAAATYSCQKNCANRAKYGTFPSDYRIYNFRDRIQFVVEGITYTGIVLDSCGACMYHINGEKLQRYDIFVPNGSISSSLSTKGKNTGKITAELVIK